MIKIFLLSIVFFVSCLFAQDKVYFGAQVTNSENNDSVVITQLYDKCSAKLAGIRPYDEIYEVNSIKIANVTEFINSVKNKSLDEKLIVNIRRDDKDLNIKVPMKPCYYIDASNSESDEEYIKFINKSIESGSSDGLFVLGMGYIDGKYGFEKDLFTGLMYINQASMKGHDHANTFLGNLYSKFANTKYPEINVDYKKAIEYYQKSSGYIWSDGYLANLYYDTLKDYEKSKIIFENIIKTKAFKYLNHLPTKAALYSTLGKIYKKEKNYELSHKYFIEAAKLGNSFAMHDIYLLEKNNHSLYTNSLSGIQWLEKAAYEYKNKWAMDDLYFSYKIGEEGRKEVLEKLYDLGHIQSGCALSHYYGNNTIGEIDFEKSFNIAIKLSEKHSENKEVQGCYSSLGYLYQTGYYVAQNMPKTIEIHKIDFNNSKNTNYITSEHIADLYLEKLEDYENAQKWYQITYDLTKDTKYLTKVEEYKKLKPVYKIDKEIEQQLIPTIETTFDSKSIMALGGTDNDLILSTKDKTINIYDGITLQLKDTLIPWKGFGSDGLVSQMAYDKTNNLLYCAGMNDSSNYISNDIIKVFDLTTKKIINTIDNPKSYLSTYLAISDDGKYLVSINSNDKFNIINTISNKVQSYHGFQIKYLKAEIKKVDNDYIAYLLDSNNNIKAFSINKERQIKQFNINGLIHFTDKYIMVEQAPNTIKLLDYDFNEIKSLQIDFKYLPARVSLSEEENNIVLTKSNKIHIYNIEKEMVVNSMNFDEELIVSGYNEKIDILYLLTKDNLKTINLKTNKEYQLISQSQSLVNELELKSHDLTINLNNDQTYKFNLKNLKLNQASNTSINDKDSSKYYGKTSEKNRIFNLYNKISNELITTINLLDTNILNYKIVQNKYIILSTGDISMNLLVFNMNGKVLASFKNADVLQKYLYHKSNYLFTSGGDGKVHIWDLKKLNNLTYKASNYDQNILKIFNNMVKGNPLDNLTKKMDEEDLKLFQKTSKLSFIPTEQQVKNYFELLFSKKQTIKPLASLYIKNEKNWIIYTPEGLFTYGGDGKDILKYHQNQGLYKEAKVIENEKLFDKFYRPDLIKKILAGEKVNIPMDVKTVIQNIKPPELKILSNKLLKNKKDIDLTYQICDAGSGISDPKLIINGQAINPPTSRGFSIEKLKVKDDKCKVYKSTHTLSPGENTISLKAYDKDKNIASQSEAIKITAVYKIEEKPNLYLLSIAVSDYEDDNLDLKYPVKDVETVKAKLQKQSKTIYENIFTYALHDTKVTKEKIESTFDKISNKIKINDAFVLYIAGHGISKDGLYQFIPHQSKEIISIDDIKTNLSKIATTKSLVLLDTCQSGAAVESVDTEATKNRLAHDSTINYIVASSSDQVALEGYKEHGVFTYSVLDAFNKNDKLKVWGLADHVSEIVPKITQEKFQYTQVPQAKLNKNFILISK